MRYQAALRPDIQYSNRMSAPISALTWLEPGDFFPPAEKAWATGSDAPGLLAAGGDLSVTSLVNAYNQGIFPWFSDGQPILWWSTNPRMVLRTGAFRLHRSMRKTLQRFAAAPGCEVRMDTAFAQVINSCAQTSRRGQPGTWILPDMVNAYTALHAAGLAHSLETWIDGKLVGGLYCVALGQMVFGESMFSRVPDASKIALAALVAFCRENGLPMVDCQQNTAHLASLGAAEMPRAEFVKQVQVLATLPRPDWRFEPLYWNHLFSTQGDVT
jgi:leucyl/phenylalanyl-tRNA--protein transferase